MQEISVYLNKRAGNSDSRLWEKEIMRTLFRSQVRFRRPQDLTELEANLNEDIEDKVDSIISVGGDGTANTLIQKLARKNIRLLVIPGGTANDLAGELGTKNSIRHALAQIRARETKYIDLISVNGQYMATNGGLGFGGRVATNINNLRSKLPLFKTFMKYSGKGIYSLFAATELLDPSFHRYKFKVTSEQFTGIVEGPAILINNQQMLGGSFKVAPGASNSDGRVNVSIFGHKNRAQVLQCLWSMAKGGNLENDPHLISFETDKLEVELLDSTEEDVHFFGDGEVFNSTPASLSSGNKWEIEVLPQSLLVYCMEKENAFLSMTNQVSLF